MKFPAELITNSTYSRQVLRVLALTCLNVAGTAFLASATAQAGATAGLNGLHASSRQAPAWQDDDPSTLSESKQQWHEETYAGIVERYWRWALSIPAGVSPIADTTGANCGINQHGPVWFLAAPGAKTLNDACTLPAGTAILSGLFDGYDDYPCPDPTFGPAPGQSLEAFLHTDILSFVIAPYVSGSATLDGKPLKVRRVKTSLFEFTAAASLATAAFADTCITGSPQLAVADGHYVFIEPLPSGRHILHLQSADNAGNVTDVTTTLIVK